MSGRSLARAPTWPLPSAPSRRASRPGDGRRACPPERLVLTPLAHQMSVSSGPGFSVRKPLQRPVRSISSATQVRQPCQRPRSAPRHQVPAAAGATASRASISLPAARVSASGATSRHNYRKRPPSSVVAALVGVHRGGGRSCGYPPGEADRVITVPAPLPYTVAYNVDQGRLFVSTLGLRRKRGRSRRVVPLRRVPSARRTGESASISLQQTRLSRRRAGC